MKHTAILLLLVLAHVADATTYREGCTKGELIADRDVPNPVWTEEEFKNYTKCHQTIGVTQFYMPIHTLTLFCEFTCRGVKYFTTWFSKDGLYCPSTYGVGKYAQCSLQTEIDIVG